MQGMSDTHMDRRRCTTVLLRTLICWTLIGLCCAGPRPFRRGERSRYPRHHDRWSQRIQYPSLRDQGTQQIAFPSVNDESTQVVRYPSDGGQRVQYPSVNDEAGSQIQVKKKQWRCDGTCWRDLVSPLAVHYSCQCLRCGWLVSWRMLSLKAKVMLWLLGVNC